MPYSWDDKTDARPEGFYDAFDSGQRCGKSMLSFEEFKQEVLKPLPVLRVLPGATEEVQEAMLGEFLTLVFTGPLLFNPLKENL